jgi:hypothetical protein
VFFLQRVKGSLFFLLSRRGGDAREARVLGRFL